MLGGNGRGRAAAHRRLRRPAAARCPFARGTLCWRAGVGFLAFLLDGKTLVTGVGFGQGEGVFRRWDVATGLEARRVSASPAQCGTAFCRPTGRNWR